MLRILVPIDGSHHSLRVIRHVIKLRAELRQELEVLLLNVQPPVPMKELLFEGRPSELGRLEEPIRARGAQHLVAARERLDAEGIACQSHVEMGDPASTISRYAVTYHCELIVMGTHGQSAFSAFCLGSVSAKVVHQAPVPVLLVP